MKMKEIPKWLQPNFTLFFLRVYVMVKKIKMKSREYGNDPRLSKPVLPSFT